MNKYSFETQITVMDMYRFQFRHCYLCVSGFISVLVSIACLIMLLLTHESNIPSTNIFLIIGSALFTVIQPFNLLSKSYKMIALTSTFAKPLEYLLDEEGVHVSQEGETADLPWEQIIKVIETKTQLVIYNTPKNGFILPKKQLKEQFEEIKNYIKENVSEYCIIKIK